MSSKWKAVKYLAAIFCLILVVGIRKPVVYTRASVANQLTLENVSDLSQLTGDVEYQTVLLPNDTQCTIRSIKMEKDGMVKLITNASTLCINYTDKDGAIITHPLKVTTRIYCSSACVEQVGTDVIAYRNQNSNTSALYLKAGEYFVQFEATDPMPISDVLAVSLSGSVKAVTFCQECTDTQGTIKDLSVEHIKNMDVGGSTKTYQSLALSNASKSVIARFTISKPGAVKLITNASNLTQTNFRDGKTQIVSPKVVTRVYQNEACTRQIGIATEAIRNQFAETNILYLERGTYYVQYDVPDAEVESGINGMLKSAVLYQAYPTDETYAISSQNKCNALAYGKQQKGFLSEQNKSDYYQFKVKQYIPVKLWCRIVSEGKTVITLYDRSLNKVRQATGSGSMEQVGFEKYVKPGTYYVKITSSALGTYEINLGKPKYYLDLNYHLPEVTVKTVVDYQEIRYLRGNYYDTDLNSSIWRKGKVLPRGKHSFTVNQKGYYTVRVTDANGKRFIKRIHIAKVDQKKPAKPVFTSCHAGKYMIQGTAEKNSTVYVTVNSYKTVHKVKVSRNGTFRVVFDYYLFRGDLIKAYAVDQVGNRGRTRIYKIW